MKAIYGPVTNVRPVKSQGVTRIEIEVPIESHIDITALLFDKPILITLAPDSLKNVAPYGPVDSEDLFDNPITDGSQVSQIATFGVSELEVKDIGGSTWSQLGSLCQSAIEMSKHEPFQKWAFSQLPENLRTGQRETDAAEYIRDRCKVDSRKELDTNPEAKKRFMDMMAGYRRWLATAN